MSRLRGFNYSGYHHRSHSNYYYNVTVLLILRQQHECVGDEVHLAHVRGMYQLRQRAETCFALVRGVSDACASGPRAWRLTWPRLRALMLEMRRPWS